jgi:hypothetical protein
MAESCRRQGAQDFGLHDPLSALSLNDEVKEATALLFAGNKSRTPSSISSPG